MRERHLGSSLGVESIFFDIGWVFFRRCFGGLGEEEGEMGVWLEVRVEDAIWKSSRTCSDVLEKNLECKAEWRQINFEERWLHMSHRCLVNGRKRWPTWSSYTSSAV